MENNKQKKNPNAVVLCREVKRIISLEAHVDIKEENLEQVKAILNANPNIRLDVQSGVIEGEFYATITGNFPTDRDFADFWCSFYSGELSKLFSDIENASWTKDQEKYYPTVNIQVAIEVRQDWLNWLEGVIASGIFTDISDFTMKAIQDLCFKLHQSNF